MFPHIVRVAAPDAAKLDWGWALPSLVRLLADPDAHVGFPHCPILRTNNVEDERATAIGYWTALDHLLRFQLGWKRPAQGLARWLDRGAPDDCRPLALVNRIWRQDGHLERYLSWRIENNGITHDEVPASWARRLAGISHEFGERGVPLGPWQLHLGEPELHTLAPLNGKPPAEVRLIGGDQSRHTPDPVRVMIFDDPAGLESGWYGHLHRHIPDAGPIQVISLRHGPVGLYRRSPRTKRWHTVDEASHRTGNRV